MAGLASLALVAGLTMAATPASAQEWTPDGTSGTASVEQQVWDELAADGTTTFWVYLHAQADLSAAAGIADRDAQGWHVYEQLTQTAADSQANLVSVLEGAGVEFRSFWIANTVQVTGDAALVDLITAMPEVSQVTADRTYELVQPQAGTDEPRVNNVEWGVNRVRAPEVWDEFGVRGEDIVVGTIDTGVQYDHPALVNQYRGNLGGGEFDHNYNWHDPSLICGNPSLVPCDNNGHGTHVTGTIVGDDGGDNQIGVAPEAQWIAAKGCETTGCSTGALLSSGEFITAPTDLEGENPDPTMRPHIVNNSWGGGATDDPWYRPTVEAWIAAGIFPQFANGNAGPGCGSSGNPGNLPESYAAGAFDINDNIAAFSSRGPSAFDSDEIKPNLSAPGVNVRSSLPGDSYGNFSGTSMASPHVAGVVALMWSAAVAIERDIDTTRELLDTSAEDTEDLTCGGTAENNNVWGQGKVDAFESVELSPRGPTGLLSGTVTDADSGDPIGGATVTMVGEVERDRTTAADGTYSITLPIGEYTVTAGAFGYADQTVEVTIEEDGTHTVDFQMEQTDNVTVTGQVTDGSGHGWPMYSHIDVAGTPVSTFTDPLTGQYSLTLPAQASYTFVVNSHYPGYLTVEETVGVGDDDQVVDLAHVIAASCTAPGYQLDGADCVVVDGGLVLGHIDDANTGEFLNGATVTSDANPSESGTSVATPDDPALEDGFYWLFSSLTGEQDFTAAATNYSFVTQTVDVTADTTNEANFSMPAGFLTIDPTEVEATVQHGDSAERTFTITNTGSGSAEVELTERRGGFELLAPQLAAPETANFSDPAPAGPSSVLSEAGSQVTEPGGGISPDWDSGPDAPAGIVRYAHAQCEDEPEQFYVISGVSNGAIVNSAWRFDAETQEWETLASVPTGTEAPAAACYDGRIYVMGGSGTNAHFVYDIASDSWSAAAPVPRNVAGAAAGAFEGQVYLIGGDDDFFPGNGVSDAVNVYDIATDSWSAGASMPEGSSNPGSVQVDEFVYVVGGWDIGSPASNNDATQRYDMSTDTWEVGPEFSIAKADFALSASSAALYAIGGDSDGSGFFDASASVYRLDLGDWPSGSWEDLDDPLPGPRTANQAGFCTTAVTGGGESWSVGGIDATFTWQNDAFYRESGEGCGGAADLPWLEVSPETATIQPGESLTVTVTMDSSEVDQPGTYTAGINIASNTPQRLDPVGVTMNVTPAQHWGKIAGTVTAMGCDGMVTTLAGAVVRVDGRDTVGLVTDSDGEYGWWMDARGRQSMLVAKDGYIPQSRSTNMRAGGTTVENFTLTALC